MLPNKLVFTLIILTLSICANGQDTLHAVVSFYNGSVYAGMDNYFRVLARQPGAVRLEQLTATESSRRRVDSSQNIIIKPRTGGFSIRPEHTGVLRMTVLPDGGRAETYRYKIRPITATPRVGPWNRQTPYKNPAAALRAQRGLYMEIENLDINARCKVISYEVIRVWKENQSEIALNEGDEFTGRAKELIQAAQPGNRYIFTKIRYRCPGAQADQMGETLSFELK